MSSKDEYNAIQSLISSQAELRGHKSVDIKLSKDIFGNVTVNFREGQENLEVKFSKKEVDSILLYQPQAGTIDKINDSLLRLDTGNKGPGKPRLEK